MAEGGVRNGRDNTSGNEASLPERQTIRVCYDRKRPTEGGNTRLKVNAVFFYAEDKMVASNRPVWLHTAFDTLTGLFNWVDLNTNE